MVSEVQGNKALLGASGGIASWVLIKDLRVTGGATPAAHKAAAPKTASSSAKFSLADAVKSNNKMGYSKENGSTFKRLSAQQLMTLLVKKRLSKLRLSKAYMDLQSTVLLVQ